MFSGEAKIMGFYLHSQAERTPPNDNLPRLLNLIADGQLKCKIEKEANWNDVGKLANDLLNRRFHEKAVMHII